MLRVLQHYLPVRTALLVLGDFLILAAVVGAGMSQHLWELLDGRSSADTQEIMRILMLRGNLRPNEGLARCLVSTATVVILTQIVIAFSGLYEFSTSSSRVRRAARFVEAAGAALGLSLFAMLLARGWGLERVLDFPGLSTSQSVQHLVASLVFGLTCAYMARHLYHGLMRRVNLNQRLLVLGSLGPAHSLARQVLDHPAAGYEVVGMIPEGIELGREGNANILNDPHHQPTEKTLALVLDDVTILGDDGGNRDVAMSTPGSGTALMRIAREKRADLLVVALQDRRRTLPTRQLMDCRLAGLEVREREEVFEEITGRIAVSAMRPSYLIFNEGFRMHAWADLGKRVVDVSCALILLALLWPVMLLTALAVKVSSPGPIMFRQERVGLEGNLFTLSKFRSMRADAEKATGPVWSSEDDPRITKVGRFMRKTRLDELPQLFNILSGGMSLVGPRPERQHFVDSLAERIPYYHHRHIVKPGLTGWAQINHPYGNTEEDSLAKLQYDLFYIKNRSFLFDLSILASTIRTVVLRQGT